jgi:hypothetical protein
LLQLTFPSNIGLRQAWVDGVLAHDASIERKQARKQPYLRVVYPEQGPIEIELLTATPDAFAFSAVTWHELPGVLMAPFMGTWPDEARPAFNGPRAEKIQRFELPAAE